MNRWQKTANSNAISFTSVPTDDQENSYAKAFHQIYLADQKDTLVAVNNALYTPSQNNVDVETGNVLRVNATYLKQNPVSHAKLVQTMAAKNSQLTINVYLPQSRIKQLAKAKASLLDWLAFQKDLSSVTHQSKNATPKINFYQIDDGTFLNYSLSSGILGSLSSNPIIVQLPAEIGSDDFYYAAATRSAVQFLNKAKLNQLLQKYNLNGQIAGITTIKSTLSNYYSQMAQDKALAYFTLSVMALELIFLLIFVLGAFFARNRYQLAIRSIHGVGNGKILARFIAINAVGDGGLLVLSLMTSFSWFSVGFTACLLGLEIGLLFAFYMLAENRLGTTLNQGM